jgi:hypothetical protein
VGPECQRLEREREREKVERACRVYWTRRARWLQFEKTTQGLKAPCHMSCGFFSRFFRIRLMETSV